MEHLLDPCDALLRTFIGLHFHKAICKTSKKIAPNHDNRRYVQQSSSDSPPCVDVYRGPVSYSLVDISFPSYQHHLPTFGFVDFSDVGCSLDLETAFSL